MIKSIIFDFFGVICPDLYWTWLKVRVPDLESQRDYFQKLSDRLDLGEISPEEFIKTLSEKTDVVEKDVVPQMFEALVIDEPLISLIKELKKTYKIGLLSNSNSHFIDQILTEHNLGDLFDAKIISEKVGFIKPQPEIFKIALDQLNSKPEEAIFVDDREGHAKAAEKVGIEGLVFKDAKILREELKQQGILVE